MSVLRGSEWNVETRMFESSRIHNKKRDISFDMSLFSKSARRDSNPRPRPWQGRAPPTEPLAHMRLFVSVCQIHLIYFFKSARRDSNPRPRPWQGRAPPTEPLAHMLLFCICLPDTFDIILWRNGFVNNFLKKI